MSFRFRKSIRLLPGIRINLSKSGVSASIGKPGASVNIGDRGTRGTVGIPGMGISFSKRLHGDQSSAPSISAGMSFAALLVWGVVVLVLGMVIFA